MKTSFKDLVGRMQALEENQQGKLRGGFASASSNNLVEQELEFSNKLDCTNSGSCGGSTNDRQCSNTRTC
jgi:hypothetical protein